jgi:uncharacterized protein (TIGR03118 family)
MTTRPVALNRTNCALKAPALFLTLATFALASCGGGGGNSNSTMASAPASQPPAATPAPTDAGYSFKSLVADHAGTSATTTDPNLVNPWGIVIAPNKPVWTANNGTQTSTLYDGNGKMIALVVKLPSSQTNGNFSPTGIAFNGTNNEFVVSAGGKSGAASFIYSGEAGMIAGWSTGVDPNNAIVAYTDNGGAAYTGLALANNGTADFLYATDFRNNKIDVFDVTFAKQPAAGFPFTDPQLPAGYAPFGIQAIQNGSGGTWQLYVTYAQQAESGSSANNVGAGLGLIDIYDAAGKLVKRLVSTGAQLNAPWGVALAPKDFGSLSNMLLVGNLGDGKINAFDPSSGAFVAAVADGTGAAFSAPGLWGIAFGNDAENQPHNTLFYAAGTNDYMNGEYGRIDVNASSSPPAPTAPPIGY